MVQLLEIYHTAQEGCIFFGNMYNDLRAVMCVVPGHALVVGKVAGKGETYLFLELHSPLTNSSGTSPGANSPSSS